MLKSLDILVFFLGFMVDLHPSFKSLFLILGLPLVKTYILINLYILIIKTYLGFGFVSSVALG